MSNYIADRVRDVVDEVLSQTNQQLQCGNREFLERLEYAIVSLIENELSLSKTKKSSLKVSSHVADAGRPFDGRELL